MKTERIFWFIFIGAFILRLLNVPGNGILTIIDLFLLSILYFPGGFYFFCDKEIKRQNIALSIVSGCCLSLIPIGIMFKLQHYPGQSFLMINGIVGGLTLFVVTYILRKKASEDLRTYYKNMSTRTLILSITIIFFTFLPTKTIIQIQYHNDPELVRIYTQVIENPDNRQYIEDLENAKDSRRKAMDSKLDMEKYYNKGYEKFNQQDYKGAIQDFNKAIEIDSNCVDAYLARGAANDEIEDYKLALQDYNKTLALKPNYGEAYFNRGLLKIKLSDKNGACLDFKKASELGIEKANDKIKETCN